MTPRLQTEFELVREARAVLNEAERKFREAVARYENVLTEQTRENVREQLQIDSEARRKGL